MHRKKNRISILAVLFSILVTPAISQVNTYSPYTRFGLGDLAHGGFGQSAAMGGTGLAIRDANKLNYMNPAAYAARDSMSVLLDFGMTGYMNDYRTNRFSNRWYNINFHHIALSIPVGNNFALGTGIVPYSSVGYNIKQEYDDLGTGDAIDYYYRGQGGILKYFAGISAKAFERVSVGVNMNYLLGDISRERALIFPRNPGFAETRAYEEINISNVYFGFGLQYREVIGENFFFTLAATYDMEAKLNSAFNNAITNKFVGSSGFIDSTLITNIFDITSDVSEQDIVIPAKTGIGLAVGIPGKLTVTADYYQQDWQSVDNSSLYTEGFDLAPSRSMHAGVEYTPDFEAFRGYHNLMSYRVGGYMKDAYVQVGDYQLKDYGITFGVGLPLGRTRSSMNVAFTMGTRGTLENNLIKENYGILTFSVTLHDLWFFKRKFD